MGVAVGYRHGNRKSLADQLALLRHSRGRVARRSGSDPLMLAGRRAEGMGEDETAAMSEMTGIFCQGLVSD